ncbi:MAG: L-fuculose-phosphate aldolase [Chloroflexota bacterium]|nr:MAG: L-fuculose-phosphate aldolase [Chloroflexota bacterium]
MDQAVNDMRARIAQLGAWLYDRHLTDAAGGNISALVGDKVCITPRYSGSKRQWQLAPEDVLVADLDMNVLEGAGQISREAKAHFSLYKTFGHIGTSVIHAHPRNLLVFAALSQPMPPVLEATRKFGVTPVVEYAPAHSKTLAENIVESIRGREERIKVQAVGTIAPWHGLFVMGKDLDAAFDAVERFDTNAYIILMSRLLGSAETLESQRQLMDTTIANFKEA